jgi:hypothetical protein
VALKFREIIMLTLRKCTRTLIILITFFTIPSMGYSQSGPTRSCIIASESGDGIYSTNVVTNCRVNTQNGTTQFTVNGKNKARDYSSQLPLTRAHLNAARRWAGRLRMDARNNPARFDIQAFLLQASQATSGFVLVRDSKGRTALNIVYITNGIYRSIDLDYTSLRNNPRGLMTTGNGQ